MAASKIKILEALVEASADDLAEIEAEIRKLETKLASLKAEKSLVFAKILSQSHVIARYGDVAVNGKPKRAPIERKPRAAKAGVGWPDKIVEYLRTNGPASVSAIAAALGCSTPTIYSNAPKDRCSLREGTLRLV